MSGRPIGVTPTDSGMLKMDELAFEVESLDGIDDAVKGLYAEADGKFRLNISGLPKPEDTTGLKKALEAERRRAKGAEAYTRLGKTPEEIQELLSAQERAEEERKKKAGDFEALRKQDAEKHQKALKDFEGELEAARASERSAIISHQLTTALAKAGATEDGLEFLPDRLASRIKIETVDGKRVTRIVQADGETPMAGSDSRGLATFDDLAKEIMTKHPGLFKSDRPGGGGTPPNKGPAGGGSGKTMPRSEFDNIEDPAERASIIRSGTKITD